MYRLIVRILACVCIFTAVLSAHGQTARFSGQVTDPQGAAIPNADVHVVNLESSARLNAKTDGSGNYVVPYLPAGRYRVEVSAPGFNTVLDDNVVLSVGQAHLLNVQLGVASAQSTVNVDAGSEVTQVNTQNSEVSGTVTTKEVTGLQLNGRNFTQLMTLVPGVSNQTQQDEAKVGVLGSVSYSVNGGRTEYNSFSVDGSETLNVGINKDHSTLIVYPSVDAIQEIKVLTSNYGAQYPSAGNGTTLVTTRSGTDQYHGNIYEFLRNKAFNAKGYFDVTNGAPLYRRNDFGGTIGGPFVIPHIYDGHGKTFFFFSEEVRLERTPTAFRQAVPSLAERTGDFSDVCPVGGNGAAGSSAAYPDCPTRGGGPLPHLGAVAPYATAILNTGILPAPNSYTGCNGGANPTGSCYLADVSLPTYYREELFRIDQAFSEKTHLSFHYIHDEWDTTTPIPQFSTTTNSFPTIQNRFYGPGLSLAANLSHAFSSTLLNEFVASYTNSYITLADIPAPYVSLGRPGILDKPACSTGGSDCGMGSLFPYDFGGNTPKMPGIVFGGNNAEYGGYGFTLDTSYEPWEHSNPTYSFADNISKTFGRHNFTFGGQWIIFQRNQTNGPSGAATGNVQGLLTYSNEQSVNTTGNAFADFLIASGAGNTDLVTSGGLPASFQQDSGQTRYYQRYQIAEPYFQDDWKVTSRLTINAGLRVSLFGTYHEKNHNAYNWVPSAFNLATARSVRVSNSGELLSSVTGAAVPIYQPDGSVTPAVINGLVQCGVNGVPDGCMTGHLWNPAPRIGFAWDPKGNGKNSIRAGYGIFYEHGTSDEANTGSLEGGAPTVLTMMQLGPQGIGCIGNVAAGCPGAGPGAYPLNVTSIPTKAVWSNVQQWSFSAEHQFFKNALASFAYVGSKGTHLTAESEANQLNPVPAGTTPFAPHEPLLGATCVSLFGTGESTGFDGYAYHLPSGAVVGPTSPGFVNMKAACYGFGGTGSGSTTDPASLREYAPGIGQIYSLQNIANSAYSAFQVSLREVSGPFTLGLAYTYSHSIDDASDRSDATFVNSFDIKSNRASSSFDERHLLHISYIYELPLHQFLQHVLGNINSDPDPDHHDDSHPPSHYLTQKFFGAVLDHWQLSGLTAFESGIPFTVVNGGSGTGINGISALDNAGVYNGVGSGSYPDRVAHVLLKRDIPEAGNNGSSVGPLLLNPAAFAAPQGLTFGTSGRNSLNNPHRLNFDVALQRAVAITQRAHLEFRAEAFNVFNNTQFRIYDPTLGNQPQNTASCYAASAESGYSAAGDATTNCLTGSSFLHPVDAHRPRTIQFGMKLAF